MHDQAHTLRYATRTTTHPMPGAVPPGEPEHDAGMLRISVAVDELLVDDGETVERFDFAGRRRTTLRRATQTKRTASLLAYVLGHESGMASALHVLDVMRAGGALQDAAIWQVEAAFGLHSTTVDSPEVEETITRQADDNGWRWLVGERELTRVHPVAAPPKMPPRGLLRLFAYGLCLHPTIAAELAERGALPSTLSADDHFPLRQRVRTFELKEVEPGNLDFAAMAAEFRDEPPADEVLAPIGRPLDPASDVRLDEARASLARGDLLDAILAVFAHNWAYVANTGELVRDIFSKAGWLSPIKKIPELVSPASSKQAAAKQLAGLVKLRSKTGRYAHVLDVLIGEKHTEVGQVEEACRAFSSALTRDPGLAATWVSLGRTYLAQRRFEDGWDCFDHADRLCPQHKVVGDVHLLDAEIRARHGYLF